MKPEQIDKKFIVTCPICKYELEKTYKLTLDSMNTLAFVCPNCKHETHTDPFFLPKNYDSEKKKQKGLKKSTVKNRGKKV